MASWIFVAIACCLVSGLQAQTNYCTTTYCPTGVPNVGCNPPGLLGGPNCANKSAVVIVLNPTLQSLILTEHNTRRSQLALGQLNSFLPATRMPTISWDTELANQAGNNARSCVYGHDRCRKTAVYAWAGQNIAMSQFYGMTKTIEQLLKEGINAWWSEYNVTTQAQLNSYPNGYTGPAIGHFTQMASDQTAKLGCAMQNWLEGQWKTYYLVCNYAVTNVIGRATYKNGTVASGCTTGRNPIATLNGLCSTAETINPVPN
ncbi:antigen 5 like allergen Cul n 1-like [Anopheles maculipalpis]|uniref:antigen 5 like allergen Cul n 1-like n=1 Tax=Anopheles maculipalpis TaxID=1496333 RepID=UPI00215974D0|nr:antigen 5 like allergen Cul n 1-like [Anopheles maculipalpis]